MTRLALCCVLLLAAGVANGARYALDLQGDGSFIQIKTPSPIEGAEPFAATLELLFKPSNCSLQGVMSQRMILRAAKGDQSAYDGADVGVAAGDAVSQRDLEALAKQNDRLGDSHDFVHSRSVAGDGHVKPATMHGRGIMVDADGHFVVWSRDGKGVWHGIKVGECIQDRWTHLALTQRGEYIYGFMDGAKRNTLQMSGHQGNGYVPYYTVGRLSDGKSAGFYSANGLVDEIRVYERDLSAQDVRCGVDTRITGRERGLAAYLRLDEGAGTTLISMALPSNVEADLVGTPVWVPVAASKEVQVSPDAPDASTCVYDLSVAQPMGVHYNRLKEGQGCPNECSGHGKCDIQKGTCLCAAGFVGADCSTDQYQGYALELDGESQHVVLPPMGLHNSMQLEAWIKADDVSGIRPIRADIDVSADGAVDWSIEDGHVALTIAGNEPSKVTFAADIEADQWYFVSVAYSRKHANRTGTGSATLYIDGKPAGVQLFEKTVPVQLGAAWAGGSKFNGAYFKGQIDELRIFARVATPIETAYFHAAGRLDGSELGLVAYYSFDEEGDMAIDRSRTGGSRHTIEFGDPVGGAPTELDAHVIGGAVRANSDAPFLPCDEHCHAHGMCWNGTCACEEWYGGQWCKKLVCPNKCSGNGHCIVDNATMRFADEISNATTSLSLNATEAIYRLNLHHMATEGSMLANLTAAVASASGEAAFASARAAILDYMSRAEPKRCDCFEGFSGPDCSFRSCPNDCSDKGICVNGTCGCKAGWGGVDCSEKRCINHCSGHGECYDGLCVCDAGFTGDDCAQQAPCSGGCNGHGLCLDDTCECDDGWTGEKCEWGDGCPNFCSGRGRCVENHCTCDTMFSGPDCGEVRCPRDCSGHGDCVDGTCTCEAGWSSDDCSQSALWPMRCHSVRRGKKVTSSCRRGWVLATPSIGSQVLEIKYGNGDGAKPFEAVVKEQNQPTVKPVEWSAQARQAGEELAEMMRAGHFRDATGGADDEEEEEDMDGDMEEEG